MTLIAAIIAALAAVLAPIAIEVTSRYAAAQSEPQQDYFGTTQRSPADQELTLPGIEGQSILLRDPQAKYCEIFPKSFR